MRLPPLLVLTDRRQARRPLVEVVRAGVDEGCRGVVLREKDLPRSRRAALAEQLRALLAPVGGVLLVASDPTLPGDGVHLAAGDPPPSDPPPGALIGRSCHDRDDLAAAATAGCTYATLSPVYATRSKPGYGPALGPAALAATPLPTFALGGIDRPDRAAACVTAGAHGVAVMGAVMRADRPDHVVADLLAAVLDATAPPAAPR
jgi:thiamine-phosphate pyrophosphorylase